MNTNIVCKLTGITGPGIKAHIIPRSFYAFSKTDHKPANLIKLAGENSRISKSPVGEFDSQIVTSEGEAYFSELDSYAHDCLVRRGQDAKIYHDGRRPVCVEIASFDYRKLKLFFLSLLWRSGVTTRPLFRKVILGPHEEHIRRLILSNDPGAPEVYSVMLGIHQDTPEYGLPMVEPEPLRDEQTGIRYYRFSLGHFIACIKVDQQPYNASWEDFVLRPDAPLRFVILDNFKTTSLYKGLSKTVRHIHASKHTKEHKGKPPSNIAP